MPPTSREERLHATAHALANADTILTTPPPDDEPDEWPKPQPMPDESPSWRLYLVGAVVSILTVSVLAWGGVLVGSVFDSSVKSQREAESVRTELYLSLIHI